MLGPIVSALVDPGVEPFVGSGPLLDDLTAAGNGNFETYRRGGGYDVLEHARATMTPESITNLVDAAGLRGRAGGGFPTGHKWSLVRRADSKERYFVCNAHASDAGSLKQRHLLRSSPHRVVEAVLLAMHAVGARHGFLFLGAALEDEAVRLRAAVAEAASAGLLEGLEVEVALSTGGYVTGEETAMLEILEGRPGQPRTKPPVPTKVGLRGHPTAISNLETTLHAWRIVRDGEAAFRAHGTRYAAGTQVLVLSGAVQRPGLYEVGLETTLRTLIEDERYGGGLVPGSELGFVLPGGLSSPVLGPEALDTALDPDALADVGSSAGAGLVVVVPDDLDVVDIAIELQRFFHESSCGKCPPCQDGTRRAVVLLENLESIDQPSIDLRERERPDSPRKKGGLYVIRDDDEAGGHSYTDTVEGLDKIRVLTEFYKFRGDCRHPTEAASAIQGLLDRFTDAFEARRNAPAVAESA